MDLRWVVNEKKGFKSTTHSALASLISRSELEQNRRETTTKERDGGKPKKANGPGIERATREIVRRKPRKWFFFGGRRKFVILTKALVRVGTRRRSKR